ncbi:hypothetical protein [Streptomyces sp. NPDC057686]|uniref:hypothetical protein n=1 Tax=Streptomyces sp. NPDC057686 TaxID=3346212 RepID=UPI00368A35D0
MTGQRDGRITAEVSWENDADPVDEAVSATVNAVSLDGSRTMGPWRLVHQAGTTTGWTTAEALPPGHWKISIDVGFPALGHGDREVDVPAVDPAAAMTVGSGGRATGTPTAPATHSPVVTTTSAGLSAAPDSAPTSPVSEADGWRGTRGWMMAAIAAALAGAASGVIFRHLRRTAG